MITFGCKHCGKLLKAGDYARGTEARCPACRLINTVPDNQPERVPTQEIQVENDILPPFAPPRRSEPMQFPIVINTGAGESKPMSESNEVQEVVITGLEVSWHDISWFAFKFTLAVVLSLFLISIAALLIYFGVGMLFYMNRR